MSAALPNEGGRRENLPSALLCFVLLSYGVDFGAVLLGSGATAVEAEALTVGAVALLLGVGGLTVGAAAVLLDAEVPTGCPSGPRT